MSNYYNRQWRLPNNENKDKQSNYSMDFDSGSTQKISLNSSVNIGKVNSISMWVKFDAGNYVYAVLGEGSYYNTYYLYIGNTAMYVSTGESSQVYATLSFTVTDYITANNWHHLVLTRNNNAVEVFIDTVSRASTSSWTGGTPTDTKFDTIGAEQDNGSPMNGKLDAISAFEYVLSSSQITTLYGSSSTGIGNPMNLSPKPVAYYPLGDKSAFNGANYLVPNIAAEEADGDIATSYSPYALDFDGTNDYIDVSNIATTFQSSNTFSVSFWANNTQVNNYNQLNYGFVFIEGTSASNLFVILPYDYYSTTGNNDCRIYYNGTNIIQTGNTSLTGWNHFCYVQNGATDHTVYINGVSVGTSTTSKTLTSGLDTSTIGGFSSHTSYYTGSISNVSVWNTNLTSSQVTEIYNEGVPSNLNNHSTYSNLVSWWQLGSNSSFSTNWTVLDEKGTNNGTSANMTEDDIVDGVGSYANGTSSGMGGDEVIGDAPYSSSNSLSVNMDALDRVEDTPS